MMRSTPDAVRKPSSHDPPTFFLSRSPHVSDPEPSLVRPDETKESMYGVQSIDESIHTIDTGDAPDSPLVDLESHKRRSTLRADPGQDSGQTSPVLSRPLTPFTLGLPDEPSSLPSSPKSISNQSLRPLDEISITDEIESQAVGSGDEEAKGSPRIAGGASQLIMPSIKMPSRRPFTERGKAMGRFKVLLAGAPGSGKTALIKSIVQTCDDIVHVDTIPVNSERRRQSHSGSRSSTTEIYASTKPYPSWWSDLEDSRVLKRRKSIGEIVLERNLCFVDTSSNLSRAGQTDATAQYMYQQFVRATNALNSRNVDFQNLLAGNGGSQVDAILYLISHDTLSTDVECIRKLSELSNVIPIISKADTLSPTQISTLKLHFHTQAREAGIKPFLFGLNEASIDFQPPYAVSSAKGSDPETMDASILMSPDYVQPLIPSELTTLVDQIFDRDNLAWLRHSAAKKLLLRAETLHSIPAPSNVWVSTPPSSYAMARITDYTRTEERMAQVRLAQWATDLQRSLQNERDRYTDLVRGERAVWLTERLGECVIDGSLVPLSQTPGYGGLREKGTHYRVGISPHDPLGVVGWVDDLGRRSWVLVQIVGSVGVVGGLALWLARTWGLPTRSLTDLRVDYWCSMDR
ncbi:unnamed protein product [Penicillium salamii]|uniref:Septin-type G domain-containing protein n=1 Tax=Penicillium salamii TaxID=1612424 RepID=A0A9W4NTS7_9EURO|nr:unnamed protein product [Penicillium salamii]CAG8296619.1 unnamed protein product [Penicillium salamii]CAG8352005.1 unnamed protein product [Penicillium salamii]CAG8358875.1 unnamed protein product [Penicillium salamii]CAG8381367.1 unnamed protein product [Penicillium salamii]